MNYGIPGTRVTAYTFEADYHCVPDALARFGRGAFGFVPEDATDSEGNGIGAIFASDEQPIHERHQVCADCGRVICLTCGNTDYIEDWLSTRKCSNCGTSDPKEGE